MRTKPSTMANAVSRADSRLRVRILQCALLVLPALGTVSCHVDLSSTSDKDTGSSSSSNSNGNSGSIAVSVSAPTLTVWRGDAGGTVSVTLTRQHYDGAVTLAASTQASGLSATLNPTSLSGNTLSSTLTVAAANNAQGTGPQVVLITAKGAGVDSQTVSVQLNVTPPIVTVTKVGSGSGTVTSNPPGILCGDFCQLQSNVGASVTLTASPAAGSVFAGWSGACTGTAATCTLTMSKSFAALNATFNSTVPDFSLGVTPALVSVTQGGSGTATVNIARTNFPGAVTLAVSGAPSGLTVTPNPASVTGNVSTLNISAPLSVAAGNYPLTITATGAGVGQRTATFNVQVTPAASGGSVAFSFASCDPTQVPIWFAVQNGGGAWTRVIASPNNSFSFPVSATGGVAYVQRDGTNVSTTLIYASGAELTSIALGNPCGATSQTGTKQLNGTLNNFLPPSFATVSIGGAYAKSQAAGSFTLNNAPSGTRDLIAALHVPDARGLAPLNRVIIRRNVNYANNATIPNLDFLAAEAFIPQQFSVLISNLGADQQSISESLITANGVSAPFYQDIGGILTAGIGVRASFVPDSLRQPSDLHMIEVDAQPQGTNASSERLAVLFLSHTTSNPTVTLGPPLATPTFTNVSTTPYLRPRAQLQSQSEYSGGVVAEFEQNGNSANVWATAAYFGATPARWTLDVPDLTGAGYDPTWGLKSGAPVDRSVSAASGNILMFVGATPVDGTQVLAAAAGSSSSASGTSLRTGSLRLLRRRP